LKLLIVEDSPEVVEAISLCLQIRWPEAVTIVDSEGDKAAGMLRSEPFDLVILDLNLPAFDGLEILKQIRSFSTVPIIIVTVRGSEDDQARGLELGADDYIVKPFRPRDLVARVNAALRRSSILTDVPGSPLIKRGILTLNLLSGEVTLAKSTTKLTSTERQLLYVLMQNTDKTIGAEDLFKEGWDKEFSGEVLRSFIRKIRDKLGDNPPRIILTERGEGYRFVAPMAVFD
jgi:DNA-binding response OmpR family regulator